MAAPFPKFEGKELKVPAGGNFLMIFSNDDAKKQQPLNLSNIWNPRKHC